MVGLVYMYAAKKINEELNEIKRISPKRHNKSDLNQNFIDGIMSPTSNGGRGGKRVLRQRFKTMKNQLKGVSDITQYTIEILHYDASVMSHQLLLKTHSSRTSSSTFDFPKLEFEAQRFRNNHCFMIINSPMKLL